MNKNKPNIRDELKERIVRKWLDSRQKDGIHAWVDADIAITETLKMIGKLAGKSKIDEINKMIKEAWLSDFEDSTGKEAKK